VIDLATLVQEALLHFDCQRYHLLAWCVMPNHVHMLIETREGYPLGEVVHSWKSFTAKEINHLLGRSEMVWAADYFYRYVRDDAHLQGAIEYIESNPVEAGLARHPEDWRFSSAAVRH
jgi:REP element-mobilizing transposase RayT